MSNTPYTYNFNPGPAKVPKEVLQKAQDELIYYRESGISVFEMSHRSPEFEGIINNAENLLREVLNIPSNYRVLFLHGGGTGQFASIPLNLTAPGEKANYVITGAWSEKAAKEAEKYIKVNRVNPKPAKFVSIPDRATWNVDPEGKYLFYTDNETIHGVEYPAPVAPFSENMPVVFDMTSNFLTRPVDVTNYGAIIAGTQKNAGVAGLAIVIVRDDLIGRPQTICPSILDYKVLLANQSLYNTPPTYSIYMTGLFLQWIKDQGGLEEMSRRADARAKLVYDVIDQSNGFYSCAVEPTARSRVNACFRVGGPSGDEALEKKFFEQAKERRFVGVKGHRSVGGVRISMFNACPLSDAQTIADMMVQFQKENQKK
ncbi:PREDICTED: phosphoserine aminotransferase-like [Rhagoletis zephyria]|uniref:phosphoserine aminotransferase-like n=1 Tax=Rhagoletis zephyria TaxID=28612 RepID=UPI0008115B91|nr:PREDICTED: phosphoserine aminotransferase-like [Rhagoletis zephyria]